MAPLINYENKTVVITGATTGVGAALVEKLRAAGAQKIVALDIKPCHGAIDEFIQVDLSSASAIDDVVSRLPESIDVLFSNAGVAATQSLGVVMGVNVFAPRKLISVLQDRIKPGGAVIQTASTAGGAYPERLALILELLAIEDWGKALEWVQERPELVQNSYGFSKECAQVLTLLYAPPLLRRGVRLNSVCPGLIDTPLMSDFQESMGEPILDWMVSQSGGRKATPAEIADALAFLGSDAAAYISGTNLIVDNGFTAAIATNQVDYSGLPALDGLTND